MIQSKSVNKNKIVYDYVVIGAGIYGLYSAYRLSQKGYRVLVLEKNDSAMQEGSYVNQARVHNGYHYPRSYSTAAKTAEYFERFVRDFEFAINSKFKKIYAISSNFSYTDAQSFRRFCKNVGIKCEEIDVGLYFQEDKVESAFNTDEYAFDAKKVSEFFLKDISKYPKTEIQYKRYIDKVSIDNNKYCLTLSDGKSVYTSKVINATYASINEILDLFGFEPFPIKYEYCEVILCNVTDNIKDVGITVMDGPFFSLMPFGLTKYHSLTSVSFTPHKTCREKLPQFGFGQKGRGILSQPKTAWDRMSQLARNYLIPDINYYYKK